MSTSLLPSYSNPCLAVTSQDISTAYLIGVPDTEENVVQVTAVNITDLSRPTVKATHSTDPNYQWSPDPEWKSNEQWKSNAHKVCFSYLGNSTSLPGSPIHIQQIGHDTTQQVVYFPATNSFDQLDRYSWLEIKSRQSYAFISQAGFDSWAVGVSNWTYASFDPTLWRTFQWVGRPGVQTRGYHHDLSSKNLTSPLTEDPLLTVGSFMAGPGGLTAHEPNSTATGRLVVFDKKGAGVMYKTESIKYDAYLTTSRMTTLDLPQAVNMDGIKLTPDAVYANINTGAYILDKADDGAVATYFIDPTISNSLQRVSTLNKPPPFPSIMTVAAAGPLIVLYAATNSGVARLHFLNTTSKEWDKSYLPISGTDSVTPSQPAGNHIAAIIGGAVGGIVLLAIGAFFFIRHRWQQRNSDSSEKYDTSNSSSSDTTYSKEERLPQSEQRPQFPAGVGLAQGKGFDRDLSVSLLGPQGVPLQPQYHKPPPPRVDPSKLAQYDYTESNTVQAPQDWRHRPQMHVNNGINGYTPPVLRRPPAPPAIPTRPSNHVHYSLVQPQDSVS